MEIHFNSYQIKCVSIEDSQPLFQLITRNMSRLKKYFPITVSQNLSIEATQNYVKEKQLEALKKEAYTTILSDINSNEFLGLFIVKKINLNNRSCELAYFIDASHEGKGIISQAINQVIPFCFKNLSIDKILLQIGLDNPSSLRIAEKNNFIKTHSVVNGHKDLDGIEWDIAYFELSKSTYFELQ